MFNGDWEAVDISSPSASVDLKVLILERENINQALDSE